MAAIGRCKTGRHVIRSHGDRRSDGRCAFCAREADAAYRQRCRDAYRLLKAAEVA